MVVEMISWPISMKECCRTRGLNPWPSVHQAETLPTKLAGPASFPMVRGQSKFAKWTCSWKDFSPYFDVFTCIPCRPWPRCHILCHLTWSLVSAKVTWAAAWQNQQNDTYAQQRLRSAWASVCMKKARVLSYPLSKQRRRWSDCEDAQAYLSLWWVHVIFLVL